MKKNRIHKNIATAIFFLVSVVLLLKFSAPRVLTGYIKTGIGDCSRIPILCAKPEEKILQLETSSAVQKDFIPYKFSKMSIFSPKGFNVIQETVKKVYYKRKKRKLNTAAIYLLYEEPGFFVNLYPQLKKDGITDDYIFLERTMNASINEIKGLQDAFFVVMKGIFTPDLGDQKTVRMTRFAGKGRRGFLNYNLTPQGNYFDCNLFNEKGDFFKIYVRDTARKLDLEKVFAIISTAKRAD